jgi:hypothetical protein
MQVIGYALVSTEDQVRDGVRLSENAGEPLANHSGLGHCQTYPSQDWEEDCMKVEDRVLRIAGWRNASA